MVAHHNLRNLMGFSQQNESLVIPKLLINQIEDQKFRTFQTGTCFNNRNFDGFFPAKRKLSNAKSFNQSNGKSKTSFWYLLVDKFGHFLQHDLYSDLSMICHDFSKKTATLKIALQVSSTYNNQEIFLH